MRLMFHALIVASAIAVIAAPIATHAQQASPPPRSSGEMVSSSSTDPTRLVISADAACELKVGGIAQSPTLVPGERRTIVVTPGESSVECTSTTTPDTTIKLVTSVAAGSQQVVTLELASLVVKASCTDKARAATLADLGGGTLRHCVTGADWTQSDSGRGGMVWSDATKYCASKGTGWVLPTADELAELIDRTGKSQTICGKNVCHVSPKFKFTSQLFWTDMITGPGMVMMVNLILGGRHPTGDADNHDYHALCIRRLVAQK